MCAAGLTAVSYTHLDVYKRQGQIFETVSASVREGKTSPPKHYTEDSLLAAMETAGAGDMPEDAAVSYTHLHLPCLQF